MTRTRPPQGEALVAWALAAAAALVVLVTYSRLEPADLYHVSRDGFTGGLSRALVLVDFPIALVAIALVLVAVPALPRATWPVAAAAIALSAVVAWPGVVDEDDLDARWINAVPALGVLLALGLTAAATRRAGAGFAQRRPLDTARAVAAVLVVLASLPWLSAELGFHFPGDVFMGEEPARQQDGTLLAAVHLGHHHGTDGALLVLTALLLSRVVLPAGALRAASTAYLGAMLAYGTVNLVQDLWLEQVVKRGWTAHEIPSALEPGPRPIWLVILAVAALTTVALLREQEGVAQRSYSVP